ncbi:MAG TPA: FAD-dependent oxidoreductase, partial [Planctomycetota bacterium]|nr:FAD-dependent oxidoreductase [Planctomycetota bacterium]
WFERIRRADDLPMTGAVPNGPGGRAVKVKVPGFDAADTEDLTAAEIRARRRMMEVLDWFQRARKKPWRFDRASAIIGIREGRRIVGDYVLTVDDLRRARAFEDAVARGTYTLDAHDPTDDKRTYILPPDERVVPPYQIPWRTLVAKDGNNLAMAGRCFSADQLTLSSARVATTASMLGQAAGVGAALAAKRRCSLRSVDGREVRRIVVRRGARLDI